MSFGIALLTTAGLVDLGASVVRSARLIRRVSLSGRSGSRVFSDYDDARGFFHVRLDNNSALPPCAWDNASKTFSWDSAGFIEHETVPNFSVYLFKNR